MFKDNYTNYNKISEEASKDEVDSNETVIGLDLAEGEDSTSYGQLPFEPELATVYNCKKLNVRSTPEKKNDNTLLVLSAGDEVMIGPDKNGWTAVTTQNGIEGYIMSEFLSLEV